MKTILILFSLFIILTGCVKNNPDPSWIEVNEWMLLENANANAGAPYNPGVLTHSITDAWVYVDNELIGVFEVPFKVPVLKDGDVNLKIYPAVRNNGISATKKIYPFLVVFEIIAPLAQNEVYTVTPTTKYYEQTKFWIEDFEDASFKIIDGNASLASIVSTTDPTVLDPAINEGKFGRVILDETNYIWFGTTIANQGGNFEMPLPSGQEVYLEIDYHNTESLTTGVVAVTSGGSIDNVNVRINAQDCETVEWKKIYIDMRDIVSGSPNADYFELSFQALFEGTGTREINIDNIKAVYF